MVDARHLPSFPCEVSVAGSTSNLGPGFDLAGLALSLSLRARVLGPAAADRDELSVAGTGASGWPLGADNLLLHALHAVERELGARFEPLRIEVETEIPVARGLGSSGAAVAAGLLLGAALSGRQVAREQLLRLGLALEGHPDNVAATLYGGLTLCLPGEPPILVRQAVDSRLAFAVAWTDQRLATAQARAVLPASVPFRDAVENARRLPVLLEGLRSGRPELIRAGGQDRLHVPYRLPLITGGTAALAAAERAGAYLATVSGSGSALLAICAGERAQEVAQAMAEELRSAGGGGAQTRVLSVSLGEPQVVSH